MAFTEQEIQAVNAELEKFNELLRPPEVMRETVDVIYRIEEQSVEFCELRRISSGNHNQKLEFPFAKVSYFRSLDMWRLYFLGELGWQNYATIDFMMLEDALAEIWADPCHCFPEY